MEKYKLMAIDIDGTLVNEAKVILPETMEAIYKAREKGVEIVIATGRSYPAAKRYYEQFDFNLPLILYNGSCVRYSKSDEVLLNQVFDVELAKRIFKTINDNKGVCCFWKNDKLYFNVNNEYAYHYEMITSIKPNFIDDLKKIDLRDINKFIWFDFPEKLEEIKKNILAKIDNINFFTSAKFMLEIVPFGISKGATLKFLAESLGIEKGSVIAVGDDENDISMIDYAGLGVAMSNAKKAVLDVADYVTDSNEKNGVGKIINKFIL